MTAQAKLTTNLNLANPMPLLGVITKAAVSRQGEPPQQPSKHKAPTNQLKKSAASKFSKAATVYNQHANVQKQAADDLVKLIVANKAINAAVANPVCVDLGAGPLVNTPTLTQLFSKVLAIDLSLTMLQSSDCNTPRMCADMDKLPLQANSVDVVFSNFAVQWSADLAALFASLHHVLKPGGQAYISCVAEGSLAEIKTAFSALDSHSHINRFNSEQHINQSVKKAGFSINSTIKKRYVDEFATPLAAIRSIKAIGATAQNTANTRRGLLTKHALQRVCHAYPLKNNRAQVSYHVILLALTKRQ